MKRKHAEKKSKASKRPAFDAQKKSKASKRSELVCESDRCPLVRMLSAWIPEGIVRHVLEPYFSLVYCHLCATMVPKAIGCMKCGTCSPSNIPLIKDHAKSYQLQSETYVDLQTETWTKSLCWISNENDTEVFEEIERNNGTLWYYFSNNPWKMPSPLFLATSSIVVFHYVRSRLCLSFQEYDGSEISYYHESESDDSEQSKHTDDSSDEKSCHDYQDD